MWATDLSVFDKHGAALRLYFSFMEQVSWLALTVAVLTIPNIYINSEGGYYDGANINEKSDISRDNKQMIDKVNLVTISNFFGYANFTIDP